MATQKRDKTENVRIANYGTHSNQDAAIAEDSIYRSITPKVPFSNPQSFRAPNMQEQYHNF